MARTPNSVVRRDAGDVVLGLEQRLDQQGAYVRAAQPVDHPLTVAVALDEAGETQLRQVLAGHGRAAASYAGQGRHVQFGVA
jgi:hypothetical protein